MRVVLHLHVPFVHTRGRRDGDRVHRPRHEYGDGALLGPRLIGPEQRWRYGHAEAAGRERAVIVNETMIDHKSRIDIADVVWLFNHL